MEPGLRDYRQATLRVVIPECVPEDMRVHMREIVSVHSGNPRKGYATLLMHTVCAEADRDGMVLLLQPAKFDEGMDDEKLKKWYAKFDFIEIQTQPVSLMARPVQQRLVIQ